MSLSSHFAATVSSESVSKTTSETKKATAAPKPAVAPTLPSAVSSQRPRPAAPAPRPPSPPPPRSGVAVAAAAAPPKSENDWWLLVVPGRTAMLAFATATAAEIAAGPHPRPALLDISSLAAAHPISAVALAAAVAAGSAAPVLRGEPHDGEAFGPFNAEAERANSAVALVGLFGLVAVEAIKGSALF